MGITDTAAMEGDKHAFVWRWPVIADNAAIHVALLCALPLVLLLLNTGWIYNQPGFIDTWLYIGYFEHYDLPQYFVSEKKILRLPWIWTGFAAYKIFPPLIANYVMHLLPLLGAPITLYFLLRKYFAAWIAFFTAVSLLLYVPFHGPGGWDYHDSFAGVFYLLTFWFVSNAAARPADAMRWMALAGAAWAVTLHVSIIFVNWTPLLFIQFVVLGGALRWQRLWRLAVVGLAGLIATTAVFCIGNYLIGRDFFFQRVFLGVTFKFVTDPENQIRWWHPWSSGWFLGRDGLPLALLAMLFVPACWLVATRWRRLFSAPANAETIALALQAQFAMAAVILVGWQVQGQTSLQPWYMADPILYPAMLAFAAQLHLASRGRDYRGAFVLLVIPVAYVVVLGGCKALQLEQLVASLSPVINENNIALLALAFYLAAMVCLYVRPARFAGFATFALLIVAADAVHVVRAPAFVTMPGIPNSRADVYGYPETCELREDLYRTTVQANQYLSALKIHPTSIAVWWDDSESFGLAGTDRCRLSSKFLAIPMANTGFTAVSDPVTPTVDDALRPRRIAVLSADPAHKQAIIERINSLSKQAAFVTWVPIDEKHFDTRVLKSTITLLMPRNSFPEQAGTTNLGNLFQNFDASRPARIKAPPQPWAYGAVYPSTRKDLKGPLWIEITGRFTGGPFGVALVAENQRDYLARRRVDADPEIQHVTFVVPKDVPLGDLVVAAWDVGNSGDVAIESINVIAPPASAR